MEKANQHSSKSIGYLLERTTRVIKLRFHQAFKKNGLDLTPEQWVILEQLHEKGSQTQASLAAGSFKDAPTVSRILNILVQNGFIERKSVAEDKRKYDVTLTSAGEEIVQRAQVIANSLRQQGWEHLTEAEYAEYVRITNQIFKNFEG